MLRFKLEKLEQQRDTYWRQRAHVHWLQKGDKNTKFYHAYASARKRKNKIKSLKKEDGSVVEGEEEMAVVVTQYFHNLFATCAGHRMDELLQRVVHRVTPEMNDSLLREFTEEDIK